MLLIGSGASQHWFQTRKPTDHDIFCANQNEYDNIIKRLSGIQILRRKSESKIWLQLKDDSIIELEISKSATLFCQANLEMPIIKYKNLQMHVASPETLFLLKKSHIDYPIHWKKNIEDYHCLKSRTKDPSCLELEAFKQRRSEIIKKFKKPKVNLAEPNEKFFNQYEIKRDVPHDALHEAVKFYDKPLYKKLKYNQDKAWCSWKLFSELSNEEQLRTVQEEAFVIALERYIIPNILCNKIYDTNKCFLAAVEALATRMWAGRWKWFVIDNFYKIMDYKVDFVAKITNLI